MKAKILSLNIGLPETLEWNGKSVHTSMRRFSTPGPLVVGTDHIEGNVFSNTKHHGTIDAIVYIYGIKSIQKYFDELEIERPYVNGELGETLTVDDFDEFEISVGDIFQSGEVRLQASFPRVPCAKLNFRMQNSLAQKAMIDCGVSGVYFRVLNPGKIKITDQVERIEKSKVNLPIAEVYQRAVGNVKLESDFIDLGLRNGALPERIIEKWRAVID